MNWLFTPHPILWLAGAICFVVAYLAREVKALPDDLGWPDSEGDEIHHEPGHWE